MTTSLIVTHRNPSEQTVHLLDE